ncbi:MAG TPA: VOC family protein [Acidimicrobiales bacterium]|nr:VOC family protein [Acidimicrobiales bacterium]
MNVRGVHHVSINVDDVDAVRRFYIEVLGLTERKDRPDFGFPGAWLDAGGQQVHLIGGSTPPAQGQHFALRVDDLGSVIQELRDRGITVSDAIPVASSLQAFLNDPAGTQIELHQVGAAVG